LTLSELSPFIIGNETIGTTICKLVPGVQIAGTAKELEKQRGCNIGNESEVSFSLLLFLLLSIFIFSFRSLTLCHTPLPEHPGGGGTLI